MKVMQRILVRQARLGLMRIIIGISTITPTLAVATSGAAVDSRTVAFSKANPALAPYMGWSSWSSLRGHVNEQRIKVQALVMAKRLKQFGYCYVNIDAGWSRGFDHYGRPKTNRRLFPDGMIALARWLHARGLKLGIYMAPGLNHAVYRENCRILGTPYKVRQIVDREKPGNTLGREFYRIDFHKPGARRYVQSCADLFAHWGVDFIKMDFVGPGGGRHGFRKTDNRPDIAAWAKALKRTGRPIWLELSNSLSIKYAHFWQTYANGWRIGNDIEAYHTAQLTNWHKVLTRFRDVPRWARFAGPGGWNDLDSLEIGNGQRDGLTLNERRSVMTLWCISCSPLYLGADLTHLTNTDFKIITNRRAIAIDQAGRPATPISQSKPQQVWRVKNANGSYTVALFNLASARAAVTVAWRELGFQGAAHIVNVWQPADSGIFHNRFVARLPPHGCCLLIVSPGK